jgi:hypothetical protein
LAVAVIVSLSFTPSVPEGALTEIDQALDQAVPDAVTWFEHDPDQDRLADTVPEHVTPMLVEAVQFPDELADPLIVYAVLPLENVAVPLNV